MKAVLVDAVYLFFVSHSEECFGRGEGLGFGEVWARLRGVDTLSQPSIPIPSGMYTCNAESPDTKDSMKLQQNCSICSLVFRILSF